MKLVDFRVDARKKKLHDQDVYDAITMGWRPVPAKGNPVTGTVSDSLSSNFTKQM